MKSEHFLKEGFVEDASDVHADHEVQMARSDLFHAAEDALVLHKLLRNISEQQGLEGWVAAKITLASDYLKTVREYIEYELMTAASQQPMLPIAENRGDNDDEEESTLYSGCYVRDKEDQSNEVFIMRGSPEDRRVQITDRNGSGWNISPSRLVAVDDSDPAISKYFGKNVSEVAPVRIGSKLPQSDTETFGIEKGRGYKINNPKDWKPGDRPRAVQQLIPTQDKKDHIRSRLGKHKSPVLPEQGVAEDSDEKQSFKVSYHDPKTRQDKVVKIKARNKDEVLDYCANKGYKDVYVEQDVAEGSACNHTMEGKSCPMHGLKECPGYKSNIEETTAGSVAGVVNPTPKNKAKVGTLFGGTYKQKKAKA